MNIYLIGTGMGGRKTLTAEAERACKDADVFIGAPRMLDDFKEYKKPVFRSYKAEEIRLFIERHSEYRTAAVLLSGDVSFFSAAQGLAAALKGHKIIPVAGISSYSYMCAKLGISLGETEAVSLHGRTESFVCRVRDSRYTFVLLSRGDDIKKISDKLCAFNMGSCTIHAGSRLGYDDEKIISFAAAECPEALAAPLCAVIENPEPADMIGKHIPDTEFIRGRVPMTKSAVRAVSVARLELGSNSVLYDIGAGTGSVSAEASLHSHDVRVYAIERNDEAFELLRKNIVKFGADNISAVKGDAVDVIESLPMPTHAFIGGSGGKAEEITGVLLRKNPDIRIVINAVTLNSCSAVLSIVKNYGLSITSVCVNAAESKAAGENILMMAQNPVYIFTLEAKNGDK